MFEDDVGMLLRQIEGELLVAEAGGEDQLRALLDHAFHDPLGFGRLRHVLGFQHVTPGMASFIAISPSCIARL